MASIDSGGDADKIIHKVANGISLRKSHPNLFRSLLTLAIMLSALGVNFFVKAPAFNPYGISRFVVGFVFLVLGMSQIIVLTVFHRLPVVRFLAAVSVSVMICWGIANSQQAFQGKTSFQLPILYLALGALQIPLLIEPRINPINIRGRIKKLQEEIE